MSQVMGWDGSIEGTLANVKDLVQKRTGWPLMRVQVKEDILEIDAKSREGREEILLRHNLKLYRDITGRAHHFLTLEELADIKRCVFPEQH